MPYHISRAGATYGPYSEEEVRQMLADGRILSTDWCWTEGMAGWQPVGQVFAAAPRPAPPPPAVPPSPPTAPVSARESWTPPPGAVQGPRSGAAPAAPAAAGAWTRGTAAGAAQAAFPPDLHWALVLLVIYITCGIFAYVWLFIEATFVKKLDPASPARLFFIGYLAAHIPGSILLFAAAGEKYGLAGLGVILLLAGVVLFFTGVFSMRRSLEHYYNTAERTGLRLNPVLTFFFNMLYFQYHFSRIARWKRTGILS